MKIKLNTINDVHDFVLICNKYQEIEIYVKQDKQNNRWAKYTWDI